MQLIIISGNAEWLDRGDPTVAANGESEGGWGTASAWCPVSCLSERLQSWAVCSQVALPTQGVYCILLLDWTSLLQGNSLMMNFTATEKEKLKQFTSWVMVHFYIQPISWVPPKKHLYERENLCKQVTFCFGYMNDTLYKTDSKLIQYLQANFGDACFDFELM